MKRQLYRMLDTAWTFDRTAGEPWPRPQTLYEAYWSLADATNATPMSAIAPGRRLLANHPDYGNRLWRYMKLVPESVRGRADFQALLTDM
jgi:hypothetical protein